MISLINNSLVFMLVYNLIRIIMISRSVCKTFGFANSYRFSLINRRTHVKLLEESQPLQIKAYGAMHYYKSIMYDNQYKYLPLYVSALMPRFAYAGVNRRINYQLYLKYLHLCYFNIHKASRTEKSEEEVEQKEGQKKREETFKVQINIDGDNIRKLIGAIIASGLVAFFLFDQRRPVKSSLPLQTPTVKGLQINDSSVIEKLLENIKEIHIEQVKEDSPEFRILFKYQDQSHEHFRYSGNINNFLAMLQHYQQNKFEKVKVFFDHPSYTIWKTFGDILSLLFPFLTIALSFFIFKRFSPDSIMSKISNKKSFKIEGLRDIKVKFADVAGMEQAKREITQFVDFLKHGQKYRQIGAKIPKGALLTGPPGTGKTMLAKACAGEAGVTFFYISGSEFVEMFVGLGASKVRELFAKARMEAPSIIFIDQIDAIGKKRETSRNEEKDSTLNQLLVQMDGFSSHQTVIILAATNRKDTLDSALTRPGRFDRMVEVTLPDLKARVQIFKVHLKPLKINPNRKIEDLAKRLSQLSPGFSGADIANLCNEAAIIATRRSKAYIEDKDFEDASQRITAGYEKKNLMNPKTKERVAYHQAGHAVCGWFLKGGDPLIKLTIIPRSKGSLGYAQYLPKSSYIRTRDELIDQIAIMMGGLTSEELFLNSSSSGASDDLQKIYQVARKMVAEYGMGKSTYNVTLDEQSYVRKESQYLSRKMDEEMIGLVEQGRRRAIEVLNKNKDALKALAELLLQKETINSEDIIKVLGERAKAVA